uniref:tRNA (guanine(9)-N(1))-methyltransferase n=1 Tax=Arcella intermedia TaxID=1963864 RepID=A0A6B2LI24_9EUKA
MSYFNSMTYEERRKLVEQLILLYGVLRKSEYRMKVTITGITPVVHKFFTKHSNYSSWKIFTSPKSLLESYPTPSSLVYLTPDSPNVLQEIKDDDIYVIGGYVDLPPCPNVSLLKAEKQGLRHARLPIPEHFKFHTGYTDLKINEVFAILKCIKEGLSWENALLRYPPIIPKPKKSKHHTSPQPPLPSPSTPTLSHILNQHPN